MHTRAHMKGDRNRLSVDSVGSKQCEKITSSLRRAPRYSFSSSKITLRGNKTSWHYHSQHCCGDLRRGLSRAVAGECIDSGGTLSRRNQERNNVSSQRACWNTAERNNGSRLSSRRQLQFLKSAHGKMDVCGVSVAGGKCSHAQMEEEETHAAHWQHSARNTAEGLRTVFWVTGGGM